MLYVQLDTNWPDHPKIIRAGIEAAGLHAICMCIAKRQETDGWIDRAVLYRQGASDELIDRCVAHGLLDADGDQVQPHDWHDRNPSQAAIDAKRASKSEAGKRGNHSRHHKGIDYEECPKCQVIAGSDRTDSQDPPNPSPESKPEPCDATRLAMVDLEPPAPLRMPAKNRDEALAQLEEIRSKKASA